MGISAWRLSGMKIGYLGEQKQDQPRNPDAALKKYLAEVWKGRTPTDTEKADFIIGWQKGRSQFFLHQLSGLMDEIQDQGDSLSDLTDDMATLIKRYENQRLVRS